MRRVHRDFEGLESADQSTRSAVMNFSYHLTLGNMDEALRSIKVIKWSVAVVCVISDTSVSVV